MSDGVRLDKWLHVARVFKTRTKATHACELGRVTINGNVSKPHKVLAVGDRVEVALGEWRRLLVVRQLAERPVAKAVAAELFEDLSPPRPVLDPLERLMRRPVAVRESGAGRPTKKEGRQTRRLRDEPLP